MTTPSNSSATDLKIAGDAFYQDSLKKLWKGDEERPDIYSRQQFVFFWDQHVVEHRSK